MSLPLCKLTLQMGPLSSSILNKLLNLIRAYHTVGRMHTFAKYSTVAYHKEFFYTMPLPIVVNIVLV